MRLLLYFPEDQLKIYEAFERYKSMLRRSTNHGFYDLTHIIFCNKLQQHLKFPLDTIGDGSLIYKSVKYAIAIIEWMTLSDHADQYNRNLSQRKVEIIKLNTNGAVLVSNKLLTQITDGLIKQLSKLSQQLKEMQEMPK